MTLLQAVILFLAAVLAGALNSVAGGGSFISFPTLIFTGVPAITANATSTVALWPGSVASVGAYRREFRPWPGLFLLGLSSLVGGLLGAELLLHTPPATFVRLIPFLLLVATLLFTFGGSLTAGLRRRVEKMEMAPWVITGALAFIQLIIATYGGYFGGGIGILMLAALALAGMENIHEMNALKTLLATCINGVAVVTFIAAGAVAWPQALVMLVGAITGGYGGAHIARQLNPLLVRRFVSVVGVVLTVYFFIRG